MLDRKISNELLLKTGYVQVNDRKRVQDVKAIGYDMTMLAFHLKPNLVEIKKLYRIDTVNTVSSSEDNLNISDDQLQLPKANNSKQSDGNLFSMKIYINKNYNFKN